MKQHLKWVDEKNEGCSHLGISPDLMPRHNIRFDCFHLKCAITRRLMGYLRDFLLTQSNDIIDEFIDTVLKNFWNNYHLHVWRNKKGFASFVGNELALFVSHADDICTFMGTRFVQIPMVLNISQGLFLWYKIFGFLGITHLGDMSRDEYLSELEIFKKNLKEFYAVGARSFLLTAAGTRSHETFYMHTLRYYIPDICDKTFKTHGTGVGIFNMQGFERRNKESKNCIKRFSNNKGNITKNNLKRLYDTFEHDMNAY